jgi:hypothetical protein
MRDAASVRVGELNKGEYLMGPFADDPNRVGVTPAAEAVPA